METLKHKGKVNIPHYMFTAECCFKPKKPIESFSFAYLGINETDTRIQVLHVSHLEALLKLNWLHHVSFPVNLDLFKDICDYGAKIGDEIVEQIHQALHHQAAMRCEKDKAFFYSDTRLKSM